MKTILDYITEDELAQLRLSGYTVYVDNQGNFFCELDGKLHRLDGPATIWVNGAKEWWINGKRHRTDGPADLWVDGTKEWYLNDELHRLDGPAVIKPDGEQQWWVNGKLHRLDGPAVILADGTKEWYLNGELHRTEGPAVSARLFAKYCIDELEDDDALTVAYMLGYRKGKAAQESSDE